MRFLISKSTIFPEFFCSHISSTPRGTVAQRIQPAEDVLALNSLSFTATVLRTHKIKLVGKNKQGIHFPAAKCIPLTWLAHSTDTCGCCHRRNSDSWILLTILLQQQIAA